MQMTAFAFISLLIFGLVFLFLSKKMPIFDLKAIISRLDYLERIIEYDLLMKMAADSISYAEQKRFAVVKAGGGKADPRQTKDIAMHYMQEKTKLLQLTVSSDDCTRAIESALGSRDRK